MHDSTLVIDSQDQDDDEIVIESNNGGSSSGEAIINRHGMVEKGLGYSFVSTRSGSTSPHPDLEITRDEEELKEN